VTDEWDGSTPSPNDPRRLSDEEIAELKRRIREEEAAARLPGPIGPPTRGEPIEHGDVLSGGFGAPDAQAWIGDDDDHEPTIIDAPDPIVDAVPTPPAPSPLDNASPALVEALRALGGEYGPLGVALIAAHLSSPETVAAQLDASTGAPTQPIPEGTTMLFVGPPPQFPTPFSTQMARIAEATNTETGQIEDVWFFNLATPNAGIHLQLPAKMLAALANDILANVTGGLVPGAGLPPQFQPGGSFPGGPSHMNRAQRRAQQRRHG